MKTTIKFAKTKATAKIPAKRSEDAGYDMYACFDQDFVIIEPHGNKLIPLGVISAFDKDCVMVLFERGSTGVKNMTRHAGVIDSGFRGEWMLALGNDNDAPLVIKKADTNIEDIYREIKPNSQPPIIYPYEKAICQALLFPVPDADIIEMSVDAVLSVTSERSDGMLGSSNK